MNYAAYIASLTVTEFRAFRKALMVLYAAGLNTDSAIEMLVQSHQERARLRREHQERTTSIARSR